MSDTQTPQQQIDPAKVLSADLMAGEWNMVMNAMAMNQNQLQLIMAKLGQQFNAGAQEPMPRMPMRGVGHRTGNNVDA